MNVGKDYFGSFKNFLKDSFHITRYVLLVSGDTKGYDCGGTIEYSEISRQSGVFKESFSMRPTDIAHAISEGQFGDLPHSVIQFDFKNSSNQQQSTDNGYEFEPHIDEHGECCLQLCGGHKTQELTAGECVKKQEQIIIPTGLIKSIVKANPSINTVSLIGCELEEIVENVLSVLVSVDRGYLALAVKS